MKNFWNKIPAWLKAILLNIVLLFPILFLNQGLILLNTEVGTQFGWSLFAIIGVLTIFWFLAKKWNPYKGENDIRFEMKFNLMDWSVIASIMGLILVLQGLGNIGSTLVGEEQRIQVEFIKSLAALGPFTALPIFLALALHAGIVEEVVYRGFMQNTMSKYSKLISYTFIGILFALAHFLPWQQIVPYVLISMAFSYVAEKHKSLGVAIFSHVLIDFLAFTMIYFNLFEVKLIDNFAMSILVNAVIAMVGFGLLIKKQKLPKVLLA